MVRTAPRKLIIIFAASVLVLSAAIASFGVLLQYVKSYDKTLHGLFLKASSLEEDRRYSRRSLVLLEKRAADVDRLSRFFVERERPLEFVENLEFLGRVTKNSLALDIDSSRTAADGWLTARLTVEGEKAGLINYLELLELLPYEIQVEEILFQSTSPGISIGPGTKPPAPRMLLTVRVKTR